jgi:transcriptional regulator with XRE-family HTH domain
MASTAPEPLASAPAQEFGRFVRDTREALGLSLNEFCRQVRLSPAFVSQMERGLARLPGEDSIIRMARVLDVDQDVMLAMAGKVRRAVLAKLWGSSMMPGVLSATAGMSPQAAVLVAQHLAAFHAKQEPDET